MRETVEKRVAIVDLYGDYPDGVEPPGEPDMEESLERWLGALAEVEDEYG